MTDHDEPHAESPTAAILSELQLYGFRPFQDEPDPRPLPEGDRVTGAIADIFDALVSTLEDTRLEPTSTTCSGARSTCSIAPPNAVERELDDNEQAQRRSQREQDGSEVRSVELEQLSSRD
jgi:hypothetical protein